MPSTAAQDEFNALFHGTGRASPSRPHPDDGSSSADEKRAPPPARPPRAALPRSIRQSAARGGGGNPGPRTRTPRAGARPRRRCRIPAHRREANTGPKGVIADAQAFEQARRAARRAAGSTVSLPQPPAPRRPAAANAAAAMLARRAAGEQGGAGLVAGRTSAESEDEDDGGGDELESTREGDDAFLARWREARKLRELATGNGRTAGAAGRERSDPLPGAGPRFGAVVAVDALGFLDVVESSGRETVVVVFIYDDMVRPPSLPLPKRD